MTSDPKALQYILQTSSYNIVKSAFNLERATNFLGNSILTTEGNDHKKHRKAMLPAFGFPETKALTHIFQDKAAKLMEMWKSEIKRIDRPSLETNVHPWFTRATLDAIGEAAFGYEFGSMKDADNKLGNTYKNMLVGVAGYPSKTKVAWNNFIALFSRTVVRLTNFPTKSKQWTLQTRRITREVAEQLFDEKWSVDREDSGHRDVMSLLVKANSAEDAKSKLTRGEVVDQMSSIIFAGHETTSTTLAWSLWELSKNCAIQDKLRAEIEMYAQNYAGEAVPVSEYDGMEYMVAFIKEIFRFHPIVPKLLREAGKDIVVPLSEPIYDKDGNVLHEVFLKKGIKIFPNIAAYNRHPNLWGPDPHVFRPERWLDMKENKVKFGVYGNLGIFGAGIHACIGWRFALYEIQTFLIASLQDFRFDLQDNAPKIRRTFAGVMVPQVYGDEKRVSMPLKITPLEK